MIKYILILTLLLPVLITKGQSFELNGIIEGKDSGVIFLYYKSTERYQLDSAKIKNGHFHFQGEIAGPVVASLNKFRPEKLKSIHDRNEFYIDPTKMDITVEADKFEHFTLKGAATDKDRVSLIKSQQSERDSINLLSAAIEATTDKNLKLTYIQATNRLNHIIREKDSVFIVHHPDSYVAADLLQKSISFHTISFTSYDSLYQRMPLAIQQSEVGKKIKVTVDKEKAVSPGMIAPAFPSIDTLTGKRAILLDFWASWCIPCRQLAPQLHQLYEQYKDKVEFISISLDKNKADWIKATQEDNISWVNILEDNLQQLSRRYFVSTIPTYVLIGADKKIIGNYAPLTWQELKTALANLN
ncbi:TlpA disulfide reductase family protein [Chitinophaga sp. LS1]|uniref:TlpA disulfide reductase family protein n=1 Tax=Chitinophaga sp. LS1 TaxID=3051176 RepID=UPI002AAB6F8C|nr:TlpA disulfide reductase family protein [Chitinophaga sp. LS1]WPV68272.1 TlpA disulfide reductase family protein [Chitinophaga sp. LS1]